MAQYKTPAQPYPWKDPSKRAKQLREAIANKKIKDVKDNELTQEILEMLDQITQFDAVRQSA